MQTLESQLAGRLRLGHGFDRAQHLAVDQDLAVACLFTQARRQIDHGTDG